MLNEKDGAADTPWSGGQLAVSGTSVPGSAPHQAPGAHRGAVCAQLVTHPQPVTDVFQGN